MLVGTTYGKNSIILKPTGYYFDDVEGTYACVYVCLRVGQGYSQSRKVNVGAEASSNGACYLWTDIGLTVALRHSAKHMIVKLRRNYY